MAEISQEEAARRLGLSIKGYRAYETFREPTPRRLREIGKAFGLGEDYFLPGAPTDGGTTDERRLERRLETEVLKLHERLDRLERLLLLAPPTHPSDNRAQN